MQPKSRAKHSGVMRLQKNIMCCIIQKMISIPTVCRVIYVPKHLPTYLPPYNSKIDTKKAKKFIKTSHLEWDSLCCIHSRHWMLSSISIGQHGAGL